eukprot:gnl/TRDRNA2_/TRDRNA2_167179_c0_seq1.p1 gnl/TRDRNA2_/TRDRNA2_167179_c0~~gnl/TRDRNA2_/TRDRNA2_167179_c0_seq1.p1  ORF type:complete len:535 (-),score=70.02 gnl/TRDRNA2_/TRDRNA2_167179_c0_seq1:177-1781(-)
MKSVEEGKRKPPAPRASTPQEITDHATSFWSALVMLSAACTLFVTAKWSAHMTTWVPTLKDADVVSIITSLDIGAFLAFFPGLVYDNFGTKAVAYSGSLMTLAGYAAMYLAVTYGKGIAVSVISLCLISFLIGTGSIWLVICALHTVTCNFAPEDRGRAVGLVMTAFGLSAGIFSTLINLFLGAATTPTLLLFIGCGMSFVSTLATFGMSVLPPGKPLLKAASAKTNTALVVSIVLLTLITLPTFWSPKVGGMPVLPLITAGSYALILLFQVGLNIRLGTRFGGQIFKASVLSNLNRFTPNPHPNSELHRRSVNSGMGSLTFGQALRAPEYWLLLLVFLVAVGIGQTVTNNLANIKSINTNAGVAIFAVGNSMGRFLPGYLSDILFKVCDRVSFMIMASVLLCAAQAVMLFAKDSVALIYTGILLTATAFGSYWVLVPAIESEWFGRGHFGKIHGFLLAMSGDLGVLAIYKVLTSVAEHMHGPCNIAANVGTCTSFKQKANIGLCAAAIILSVMIKVQDKMKQKSAEKGKDKSR